MSVAKVLKLDDHRDRREHRFKIARALHRVAGDQGELLDRLAKIASAAGADRVAAVWVDEYGPGAVHPHAVLDLLADRPRRRFDIEPLQRAWEFGVPGAYDETGTRTGSGPSTFAIALGSDGARAWFVVSDSVTARPSLDDEARDRVMFLAGECSAVVLHRDLDRPADGEGRFPGWAILRDIEDRDDDDIEARRITQRFVVARLVRSFLDEDLVVVEDRIAEQVRGARTELERSSDLEPDERRLWTHLLAAYEANDVPTMATLLLTLGELAEERGHHNGAEELYSLSYGLSAAGADTETAATAARLVGRLLRRQARRDEALRWYEGSREIAFAAGLDSAAALAISGIATLVRDRGNLRAARELLGEAIDLAERSEDRSTLVLIHRNAVSLEHSAGNVQDALHHAWMAVGASTSGQERAQSLASLAGALEQAADYDLATDAWSVVAETSAELYLRVLAFDAMAHISALRGDAGGFERNAARCDALDYESVPSACVQILHYRGLSYRALGRFDEAAVWLERAVAYAEASGFNEILFKAEADLLDLPSYVAEHVETKPAAPKWIREGVQAMRQDLVGAGA